MIAVVLNDEPDNDEVVHVAMEEARRRRATVRQIDRRLDSWVRRYPDVPVQIVAAGTGVKVAENHSNAIDLAVVGEADADELPGLLPRTATRLWASRLLGASGSTLDLESHAAHRDWQNLLWKGGRL